jgi:hypothetical protein
MSTCRALDPGGKLLLTVKEGNGTFIASDGRVFTLWARQDIEKIFTANHLQVIAFSRQISKIRPDDIWLGYVLSFKNDRGVFQRLYDLLCFSATGEPCLK